MFPQTVPQTTTRKVQRTPRPSRTSVRRGRRQRDILAELRQFGERLDGYLEHNAPPSIVSNRHVCPRPRRLELARCQPRGHAELPNATWRPCTSDEATAPAAQWVTSPRLGGPSPGIPAGSRHRAPLWFRLCLPVENAAYFCVGDEPVAATATPPHHGSLRASPPTTAL